MSYPNSDIMDLARQLGDALKNSAEYRAFFDTRDAMKQNSMLKGKLDEYKVQKTVLDIEKEKEQADEHLLDILSSRLEVLYKEITDIPEMKAYNKAEEDLNLLMTAVNMTISSYIGAEEYTSQTSGEGQEAECSHDCSHCRGCH